VPAPRRSSAGGGGRSSAQDRPSMAVGSRVERASSLGGSGAAAVRASSGGGPGGPPPAGPSAPHQVSKDGRGSSSAAPTLLAGPAIPLPPANPAVAGVRVDRVSFDRPSSGRTSRPSGSRIPQAPAAGATAAEPWWSSAVPRASWLCTTRA
jgi:hypothetical protein